MNAGDIIDEIFRFIPPINTYTRTSGKKNRILPLLDFYYSTQPNTLPQQKALSCSLNTIGLYFLLWEIS